MDDSVELTPEELREILEELMKKSEGKITSAFFIHKNEETLKEFDKNFEKRLHEARIRMCN